MPFFEPAVAPESVVITDPAVWQSLSYEERRAHLQRLKEARVACRAYSSFTLRGNANFLGLSAAGGVLSSLAPAHWTAARRLTPFMLLGLVGIWLDNVRISRECEVSEAQTTAQHRATASALSTRPRSLSLCASLLPHGSAGEVPGAVIEHAGSRGAEHCGVHLSSGSGASVVRGARVGPTRAQWSSIHRHSASYRHTALAQSLRRHRRYRHAGQQCDAGERSRDRNCSRAFALPLPGLSYRNRPSCT